ncbi:MAG: hypothetical protein HYY07_01375, partial [Elusimicrobia bacterium]|nr:hypothetical protein [Elusimicrobiota bacterium]
SSSGRVSKYHIRYSSTTSINSANWSRPFTSVGQALDIEASPVQQTPPTPGDPGRRQTYLIKNLTPNLTYWFSVRAQDDAGNLSDTSNSPFVAAKPFIVRAGDGEGSASLFNESNNASLNSVPVSSQVTLNLRFTVGRSSITGGGKISVRIPDFWSFPQLTSSGTFGFVSLSTITPTVDLRSLALSLDSTDPQVVVASVSTQGKLNAGDVISFRYSSITPYQKQDGVNFTVRSQGSSSGFLALISSQPRVNISGGNAAFIQIKSLNSERGTIAISRNQSSPGILVEPLDNSYQRTAAHKDLNLRVFTLAYSTNSSFEYDSDGEVSDNNFISTLPALTISTRAFSAAGSYSNLGLVRSATCYIFTIPNGSTGKSIFYKTNATGDTALWLEWNDDFNVGSTTRTTATGFKVISTTIAFNSLTVTPSTITPDNDGTNDLATITFQPTNPDVFWRVRIGTDPILSQMSQLSENVLRASTISVLYDFFGSGYPQGLTWYGSDFMGDIVPSSTNPFTTPRYIVRVEDAGGAIVSTTSMGVQSHYLDVFVTSTTGSSIGIENAYVTVNGQSGRGYVSRTKRTGANGRAQIWGLKGGSEYTVSVNYFDPNTNVEFSGTLSGRSAGNPPASISTVTFSQPTEIRIHAFIPQSAVQSSFDQWGFANVANNANGSLVGFR